jgi:hypothetical protein
MEPSPRYSRRDALLTFAGIGSAAATRHPIPRRENVTAAAESVVERNDAAVRSLLGGQVVDPADPGCGSVTDQFGLHTSGSAAGVIETMVASFVHPESAFHRDAVLVARIGLAAGFLERAQSSQGNIDLLATNFNSPPDTGFVVHGVATAAAICRLHGCEEIHAAVATVPGDPGRFLLAQDSAVCRLGSDEIRVGPGAAPHAYTEVRGAEPRLPGQIVYVTGFTPFDHTLTFECT